MSELIFSLILAPILVRVIAILFERWLKNNRND